MCCTYVPTVHEAFQCHELNETVLKFKEVNLVLILRYILSICFMMKIFPAFHTCLLLSPLLLPSFLLTSPFLLLLTFYYVFHYVFPCLSIFPLSSFLLFTPFCQRSFLTFLTFECLLCQSNISCWADLFPIYYLCTMLFFFKL